MERVSYLTLLIYNAAILLISLKAWRSFDFKTALNEKSPSIITAQADAIKEIADAHAQIVSSQTAQNANPPLAGIAPVPAPTIPSMPDSQSSSYSRITGMFGLIIMASFLWAFGNALIWSMFNAVDNVSKITNGVGSFFLSGSALFAPYAFNQIKEAFNK